LVIMEAYCIKTERVQQQCETGKCVLENMVKVKNKLKAVVPESLDW
jgi:hypothetical protein